MAASLANVNKWPELAMPASPHLSEEDGDRPSGFPGATSLKYTQTIMGSKSGGMGLRVSGSRRSSTLKRTSGTPRQEDVQNFLSDSALAQDTNIAAVTPSRPSLRERMMESWANIPQVEISGSSTLPQPQLTEQNQDATTEGPPKVVQFIPRFKGAAEMEARRKIRMLARHGPGTTGLPPPQMVSTINLELSSSSSTDTMADEDDDEFEMVGGHGSVDDEFDP